MRVCFLAFSRKLTTSPALHWYGGDVHQLLVHRNALWLTSWRASARVAGEAHPVDHIVQPAFQKLQQSLARRTRAAPPPSDSSC